MRNFLKYYFCFFLSCQLFSQQTYRSVDEIESEWGGYASYQKEEMVSFCDFLFKEKNYERCLLSCFQLILKLKNDPIIPNIYYYIGRCYEELENYDLAIKYYNEVLNLVEDQSEFYKAAYYRYMHVTLLKGNNDQLIIDTRDTKDPYLLILQGYAFLKNNNFGDARTSFVSAQSVFNHSHYNKLITPIYKIIEDIGSVKNYNKYSVLLLGLFFPGGGHFMLKDYDEGKGIAATVSLLILMRNWGKAFNYEANSNSLYYTEANSIPVYNSYDVTKFSNILKKNDKIPLSLNFEYSSSSRMSIFLAASVLFSSAWYSYKKTLIKNSDLIAFYINNHIGKYPASNFLDFSEPSLMPLDYK